MLNTPLGLAFESGVFCMSFLILPIIFPMFYSFPRGSPDGIWHQWECNWCQAVFPDCCHCLAGNSWAVKLLCGAMSAGKNVRVGVGGENPAASGVTWSELRAAIPQFYCFPIRVRLARRGHYYNDTQGKGSINGGFLSFSHHLCCAMNSKWVSEWRLNPVVVQLLVPSLLPHDVQSLEPIKLSSFCHHWISFLNVFPTPVSILTYPGKQ